MIQTTTIRLDDTVKKEAAKVAKAKQIRGGLSGLIESLLKEYLKLNNLIKI